MVVYISKANPLAKRKSLRVKDLADQTLLLFDRKIAPGLYDKTLELYTTAGVNPIISSVAVELVPNNDLQALLLTCRKGIRIIPDEIACRPAPGSEVAVVPLDEPGASDTGSHGLAEIREGGGRARVHQTRRDRFCGPKREARSR